MIAVALGVILITLFVYVIFLAHNANQYWKRRGLKTTKPVLFFGNTLPVMMKKKSLSEIYKELCETFPDEPLLGFYDNLSPRLIVQDSELIQNILIKDFQHFMDHGLAPNEKNSPIDYYRLFTLTGAKWRTYRHKMSPLFTSGKLKQFYEALDNCGEKFIKFIEKNPRKGINIKDAVHLLIADFVGMAIFGLDAGVLENPNSEFSKEGENIFDIGIIKFFLLVMAPKLGNFLGVSLTKKKSVDYYSKLIQDTCTQRMKLGIKRNDFIQMMIQLKEKGKIETNKWDPNDDYVKDYIQTPVESFEITDIGLMAQAYTFMTTGLDTIPVSTQYCFFELATHQDIQSRAIEEIIEQTKLHSGLTYDALKNMKFLENCINESGRLHPIVNAIFRICTKDYTFPNGFEVRKGQFLHIPVGSVQTNPKYFSDPLEFKPDRFDDPIQAGTYFPFGEGPRICIAMRFAMLQMKYVIAKTLMNYKIKLSPTTKLPFKIKTTSIVVEPEEPLYFDLESLKL